jgi:hypothetical protein
MGSRTIQGVLESPPRSGMIVLKELFWTKKWKEADKR